MNLNLFKIYLIIIIYILINKLPKLKINQNFHNQKLLVILIKMNQLLDHLMYIKINQYGKINQILRKLYFLKVSKKAY